MRTIGYINWKGGVGKTTLSVNTAYALAEKLDNNKILFIDADKQGNASTWFGVEQDTKTFTDILMDGIKAEQVIQKTRYPNIDIIPADASLIRANYSVLKDSDVIQTDILKQSLENVKDNYSLCIIDFPPDTNLPVLNCLNVIDDIIAVTLPNTFALNGILQLQEELDTYNRDLNLGLEIMGVVINQFDKNKNSDIYLKLKDTYKYHLFSGIRGGQATAMYLNKSINSQKSVFEISPGCGFSLDLKRFIIQMTGRIMKKIQEGK